MQGLGCKFSTSKNEEPDDSKNINPIQTVTAANSSNSNGELLFNFNLYQIILVNLY